MTLDEQIKILEHNAEHERQEQDLQGCLNFRQLAEWLMELKDYRERNFCHYCGERDTLIFDEPCKSCKIYFVRRG